MGSPRPASSQSLLQPLKREIFSSSRQKLGHRHHIRMRASLHAPPQGVHVRVHAHTHTCPNVYMSDSMICDFV